MASLASKDSYLQSLGRKVCARDQTGAPRRKLASTNDGAKGSNEVKKKRKRKPHKLRQDGGPPRAFPKLPPSPFPKLQRTETPESSFSTVDILRKRLHDKIEESRGQVSNKSLSAEEIEKRRQKRKQERERKKRKRKALRMTDSQEVLEGESIEVKETSEEAGAAVTQVPLVFNKVKVHEEILNKVQKKKEKKERVKGQITPMTGKNYKQLLSRLEAQNNKLEALRAKDEDKAKEFESKIKWTNVLYKAEGLKIKDDEGMLKTALKRKEKQRESRKKRWDKRTLQTAERMQHRQDKRKRNLQKKKTAKVEKKKNRARKRGRVMPEDLAKGKVK
ncbi:surfeit locus protein 6 [Hyperolius riggenbachi]|uniref:surfeit locus protein 6 n=1 Tax=Hyperolius riggenbachi TaxID=752182 RepID=UPI0035A342AF